MTQIERHIPVLSQKLLVNLDLSNGDRVIDCTLGDGGHTEQILQKIIPNGRVLAIDIDPEAVLKAKQFLYSYQKNIIYERDNFANLDQIVYRHNFEPVKAIVADLGWSTSQFKERGRGFSFRNNEPLDMRYGGELDYDKKTAEEILNSYNFSELLRIFRIYGEEKFSQAITQAILDYRHKKRITTTQELVEIVLDVYRQKLNSKRQIPWVGGLHPATKVFQALRIEVNQELENLESLLRQAIDILDRNGRLAIISFHSLEDRIVKHFFKNLDKNKFEILTKKPLIASEEEIKNNPRARSAKLRIIRKK